MGALHSPTSPNGSELQHEATGQPVGTGMCWGWWRSPGAHMGCLGTLQAKCTGSSQAAHTAPCQCGSKARACHSSLQPCNVQSPIFLHFGYRRRADFRLTKPGRVAVRWLSTMSCTDRDSKLERRGKKKQNRIYETKTKNSRALQLSRRLSLSTQLQPQMSHPAP